MKKEIDMKIWTVDAFADRPFQGNPTAVTMLEGALNQIP